MANKARKINPSIIVADNITTCNHIKKYSLFTVHKNRPQMQSHWGTNRGAHRQLAFTGTVCFEAGTIRKCSPCPSSMNIFIAYIDPYFKSSCSDVKMKTPIGRDLPMIFWKHLLSVYNCKLKPVFECLHIYILFLLILCDLMLTCYIRKNI